MGDKFHLKLSLGIMCIATLTIYLLRRAILPTWIGFGHFGETQLGLFVSLDSMKYPLTENGPAIRLLYNVTQPIVLMIVLGLASFVCVKVFPKLSENKKFMLPFVSGAIYSLFLFWFIFKIFTAGFEL